jgi:hypothetical protein
MNSCTMVGLTSLRRLIGVRLGQRHESVERLKHIRFQKIRY